MTETPAEYYVSKAPKALRGVDYMRKRLWDWFVKLTAEARCYTVGLVLVAVAAGLFAFKRPEAGFLSQVGAFVFAFGLVPVVERMYEWVWRSLLGKLLIAVVIALATSIAYGLGRQMVAVLVGTSPAAFSATVHVATILLSPVLVLMALAIGGLLILPVALSAGPLVVMLVFPPTASRQGTRAWLWLCRVLALAVVVFGSWGLLNHSSGYADWVERRTTSYLYAFDMYEDIQYATGRTEKVALIGDGRILVGSRRADGKSYEFRFRQEDSGSESAAVRAGD